MQNVLKKVVNFFIVDPARKIFALILSFGLWLFVAIDGTYTYEREIPIVYTNLSDNYIITESVPKLKVSFNGKGKNLFGIWASPPKIICNLADVVPGRNVISTKDLTIPIKDLSVNYNAKFINVDIDEKIIKVVKTFVPIKGHPKDGWVISKIEVLDTLNVSGAKKILQKLEGVVTESLNVSNKSATFEKSLKIEPIAEPIEISRDNIRIRVVIDSVSLKTFTEINVIVLKNTGQRVRIMNTVIDTLIISGTRDRLDNLNKEDIIARIKVSDLVPGEYFLSPEIILPEFISLVYSKPQVIKVFIY
ncbi:MAG: hypothetical protein ABIL69_02460 [candidate division WOR-3 bacterium]